MITRLPVPTSTNCARKVAVSTRHRWRDLGSLLVLCGLMLGGAWRGLGQVVTVTVRLDASTIPVGGSTLLHVYAQVVPPLRASSERIFSWYIDVLNTNGAVATANYAALIKPESDNDALLSGS